MDYCCHGIIRDQDAGYAAEVLIHMYMSSDPGTLFLVNKSCSRRSTTDGFAEQNGRDAEQSGLILLITLRFFYNDKGHREVD